MPLHDVGYRPWQGVRTGPASTVAVIATTGIRLAWTSRWLRRAVFFAWSPALLFAGSFFAFEQAADEGRLGALRNTARSGGDLDGVGILGSILAETLGKPGQGSVEQAGGTGPGHGGANAVDQTRRTVWSRLLLAFMRVPQAVLLAVVIGLVAPSLISRDLRAKAWLIYFTRPVGKLEYILGKMLILGLLVATITMLPALALWLMGVGVSPSIWVAVTTWDLPVRIIVASLALAVPMVLMSLAYSSVTAESRIASFAWFATWAACWIAHTTLSTADLMRADDSSGVAVAAGVDFSDFDSRMDEFLEQGPRRGGRPPGRNLRQFRWLSKAAGLDTTIDRWAWLSPYHSLGVIQSWIFGIETRWQAVFPPLLSLTLVSVVSAVVLWWRVDAPARA